MALVYTYTATESSDDDGTTESAMRTFTIGVAPQKPANFTATAGNTEVTLSWTAIPGVSRWGYQQDSDNPAMIFGSNANTNGHTVTGLTNGTAYSFKVRAVVGSGDAEVLGVESDRESATPAIASGQTSTPSGVTVTSGDSSLTVAWSWSKGTNVTCPLNDGATNPSGFELQYRKTGSVWRFPFATDPPDLPDSNNATNGGFELHDESKRSFTIDANATGPWPEQTGVVLTNGTEYEVRLIAYSNDEGCANKYSDYSATKSATPMIGDLVPTLTTIADQTYTQGAAVDKALPAATGGDSPGDYAYTLTPDVSGIGLTFTAATHKLTGTPSAPKAKVECTYTATETSDYDGTTESTSKTFTIGIAPKKPENFTVTASNRAATLSWNAIAGVSGWEYQQDSGNWTTISTKAETVSHLVPGLTNGTEYTFKVRAVVGSGDTLVNGVESEAESVTPAADLVPALPTVADKLYTQGVAVDETLPAATGGDSPGSYTYTLTPDVSNIATGLAFTASTHKLTGTPSVPNAKITYTYKATETSDSDGVGESDSETFTIGIRPKKPENFTATPGDTEVTLRWTAVAGDISGWEYRQDGGDWTAITNSDKDTDSHTVTGLTNGTDYSFKVRVFIGTGSQRVDGVESEAKAVTPAVIPTPTFRFNPAYHVDDWVFTQDGELAVIIFPRVIPGHPDNTAFSHKQLRHLLSPAVPSGMVVDTAVPPLHNMGGYPDTPMAKTAYTYTVVEKNPEDETEVGRVSWDFTISVEPKKPERFTAMAGSGSATLNWTAIAGVSGWKYQQDGGTWMAITGSDASTNSHTVTGLIASTAYTFKVRAYVGIGGTLVNGVPSATATETTN